MTYFKKNNKSSIDNDLLFLLAFLALAIVAAIIIFINFGWGDTSAIYSLFFLASLINIVICIWVQPSFSWFKYFLSIVLFFAGAFLPIAASMPAGFLEAGKNVWAALGSVLGSCGIAMLASMFWKDKAMKKAQEEAAKAAQNKLTREQAKKGAKAKGAKETQAALTKAARVAKQGKRTMVEKLAHVTQKTDKQR